MSIPVTMLIVQNAYIGEGWVLSAHARAKLDAKQKNGGLTYEKPRPLPHVAYEARPTAWFLVQRPE
jgi:hypothetical protein